MATFVFFRYYIQSTDTPNTLAAIREIIIAIVLVGQNLISTCMMLQFTFTCCCGTEIVALPSGSVTHILAKNDSTVQIVSTVESTLDESMDEGPEAVSDRTLSIESEKTIETTDL